MHDKAEIRPNSKKSCTTQKSAQTRMKIAQWMPGLRETYKMRRAVGPQDLRWEPLHYTLHLNLDFLKITDYIENGWKNPAEKIQHKPA